MNVRVSPKQASPTSAGPDLVQHLVSARVDGETRSACLASQAIFAVDELVAEYARSRPTNNFRCPIHPRAPQLGDEDDIDSQAICPVCAVARRLRYLHRRAENKGAPIL